MYNSFLYFWLNKIRLYELQQEIDWFDKEIEFS